MHSSKRSEHDVCCLTFFAPVSWPGSPSVVLLSNALPSTVASSSFVSSSTTILRASPSNSLAAFGSASDAALSERAHRPSHKMRVITLVLKYSMSDDASLTITTDLERLALRNSIVVGGQPELSSGAERAEQRLELATRALQLATRVCGRDHLTRRRALGLECRLVRTRGEEDELAAVSLVWSALR